MEATLQCCFRISPMAGVPTFLMHSNYLYEKSMEVFEVHLKCSHQTEQMIVHTTGGITC